ncbi:hypothetical protein AX14_002283 [Amanita brunnescens Koide BX004]|nr:hypothetical protein AX14_002283 [Amanita brunnescens Koide BX004]
MPPKKVSFKAPAASSSRLNPIAPTPGWHMPQTLPVRASAPAPAPAPPLPASEHDPAAKLCALLGRSKPHVPAPISVSSSAASEDPFSGDPAPTEPPVTSIPPSQSQPVSTGKAKPVLTGTHLDVAALQSELRSQHAVIASLKEQLQRKSDDYRELHILHLSLEKQLQDLRSALPEPTVPPVPVMTTRSMTKDSASTAVQTDPAPITAISPNTSGKKSFAQAAKASAPQPIDKAEKATASLLTQLYAPVIQLQTLLLDTIEMICGGRDFVVLARPTLSLLKLHNIPTRNPDGSPVDLDLLTAELFHDKRITKASFWHLPQFVSFKGTPLGQTATVFFSLIDTPQYALGRSLCNTAVNIFGLDFQVQQWIPAHQNPDLVSPPTGHYLYYKERLEDDKPRFSQLASAPSNTSRATPALPSTTSPSLQHLRAAMAAYKTIKAGAV